MTGVSETAHGVPIVDGAGRKAKNWLRDLSGYQRLGLGTILGLLVLVVLGGTVRVTDSGLACPDWPLCYGELFPSGPYVTDEGRVFEGYQVSLEWTHRLVASVIGLVILAFVAGAWLKFRDRRWVVLPATASVLALVVQVLLGGLTVTEDLDAGIVASHLGVALVIVLLIVGAWLATFVPLKARPSRAGDPGTRRLARWAVGTGVATLALMVLGGYVSGTDAAFFCNAEWPLCNGSIFPAGREAHIQISHRYVALLVGLLVLGLWVLAYRRRHTQRAAFLLATVLTLLYVAQALLGAATQWTTLADWSRIMHLAMGALTWVTAVILMGLLTYRVGWFPSMSQRMDLPAFFPSRCPRKGRNPVTSQSAKIPSTATARVRPVAVRPATTLVGRGNSLAMARAYLTLTKPGIIVELLVIAVPAMVLAANGWPGLQLIALILLGGVLTGGGANALNQWYDRDIDAKMGRTAGRPVPSGQIAPRHALWWGLSLSAVGGLQLLLTVNWLSAVLALAAVVFYVLVYTMWLKRRTVHNTVLGGIAGAAPPVVGWAAVTGGLDVEAALLFLIVFFWQPPHFWALALHYRDEYEQAGIPTLPVVSGERATHRQGLVYSALLVGVSLALWPVADLGAIYLAGAIALGAGFLVQGWRLQRGAIAPMSLFAYSLVYLTALFGALALDVAVL